MASSCGINAIVRYLATKYAPLLLYGDDLQDFCPRGPVDGLG